MKRRFFKVIFPTIELNPKQVMLFIRPLGSRLYRISEDLPEDSNTTEVRQVLNTFSLHGKPINGTWFIKCIDYNDWHDVAHSLALMELEFYFVDHSASIGVVTPPTSQEIFN